MGFYCGAVEAGRGVVVGNESETGEPAPESRQNYFDRLMSRLAIAITVMEGTSILTFVTLFLSAHRIGLALPRCWP